MSVIKKLRTGCFTLSVVVFSALLSSSPVLLASEASAKELLSALGDRVELLITSGKRLCSHPIEAKKGHCNGMHVQGRAWDLGCEENCRELGELAKEVGFTGVLVYPRHVHVDNRKKELYQNVFRY